MMEEPILTNDDSPGGVEKEYHLSGEAIQEQHRKEAEVYLNQQLRTTLQSKTIVEYLQSYSNKTISEVKSPNVMQSTNGFLSPTPKEKLANMNIHDASSSSSSSSSPSPSPSPDKRNRDTMRGMNDVQDVDRSPSDSPPRVIKRLGRGAKKREMKLRHDCSYISQLNELTQGIGWSNPVFEHSCAGTAHAQLFMVRCLVFDKEFSADQSTPKLQAGKENASLQALKSIFGNQS